MKKIVFSLFISSVVLLGACASVTTEDKKELVEEVKPVSIDTKVLEDINDGMKLNVAIPEIKGMSNTEKQTELNDHFAEVGTSLATIIKKTEEELKSTQANIHAEGSMSYDIKLHNNNYLSVLIDQYTYLGGAHGDPTKLTFNYNFKTGSEMKLKDLFSDDSYVSTLSEKVKDIMLSSDYKELVFEDFKSIEADEAFYLTEDQLVLVFNPYRYTAGAAGAPEVSIDKTTLNALKSEFK